MAHKPLDDSAHLKVPDYDLGIFAGACNEAIALADVDVGDEIAVAVETSLQVERVAVPDLDNPTAMGRHERNHG